jgi:8-oxo-dGTP pyrophosphatase MutT (NUDIX family)
VSEIEIVPVSDVDIVVETHDWAYARDHAAEIEAHWAAMCAQRSCLFDGQVLLLHRFDLRAGRFSGACFETRFSRFNAWRRFGFPDLSVRNVFSMAALRAEDGAFLLGEMGPHTANAGESYFPAGTPDLSDISGGRVDLAGSVLRELEEETGLSAADVTVTPGWTLAQLGGQIAFMREVRIAGDGASAARRIEATLAGQADPELVRIHVVRRPEDAGRLDMPPFMLPFLRHAFAQPLG